MQCKNHPDMRATQLCAGCGIPLCDDCAEEAKPGQYYCFKCAMMASVSEVGTTIQDKREKVAEEKRKVKKKLTAFHYFILACGVLILAMWAFILFGGQEPPDMRSKVDFGQNTRVLLFMVDGAIKNYAHSEGNRYPKRLLDLIPKYLSFGADQLHHLGTLSYEKDPVIGYRLSLAKPKEGEMDIIISSKGIQYRLPSGKGV